MPSFPRPLGGVVLKRIVMGAAAALSLAAAAAAPAQQPKALEVAASAPFRHAYARIEFPATLFGIARSRVAQYEDDQLDTVIDYEGPGASEVYTFYVFRNVSGDVPVWFDRAQWSLEHRDLMDGASLHGAVEAFAAPGRSEAAGLAAAYALPGKPYRSTGVALLAFGEWYVKLRVSSTTLPAEEMTARMRSAFGQLRWPKAAAGAPAAIRVAPCPEPLALHDEAKALRAGDKAGAIALFNGILGVTQAAGMKDKGRKPEHRPVWCRDAAQSLEAGVYRADGDRDSYLLAMRDAGRAIWAGRDPAQAMLQSDGVDPADKPAYLVKLLLLSRILTSGEYDRLPPPDQAYRIGRDGPFGSAVPTWGKAKGNVEINLGPGK
jgi:hypothetical protein